VAARNVLVMQNDQQVWIDLLRSTVCVSLRRTLVQVKLADVGLSRLHDQGSYYKQASSDA